MQSCSCKENPQEMVVQSLCTFNYSTGKYSLNTSLATKYLQILIPEIWWVGFVAVAGVGGVGVYVVGIFKQINIFFKHKGDQDTIKTCIFFPKQSGKRRSNLKIQNFFKSLLSILNFSHIVILRQNYFLLLFHTEQLYKKRNRDIKLCMNRVLKHKVH